MRIPVYIIPTSTPVVEDTLVKFFETNKLFRLEDAPGNLNTIGVDELTIEANMIVNALEDARKRFPDSYVITIKDTSVTASNADILGALLIDAISFNQDVILSFSEDSSDITCSDSSDSYTKESSSDSTTEKRKYSSDTSSECRKYSSDESDHRKCTCSYESSDSYSLTDSDKSSLTSDHSEDRRDKRIKKKKRTKWQVAYLADWLDRCDLFKRLSKSTDLIKWVKTFSPNGIQAQFWSPRGRDIILGRKPMKNGEFFTPIKSPLSQLLNENIQKGNISAIATSPPFFVFDETLADTTTDLEKACFCRQPETTLPNGGISFIIFVILSVLALAGAWFVYITWAKHY